MINDTDRNAYQRFHSLPNSVSLTLDDCKKELG